MSPMRRRRRPPPADFAALRAFARAYLHEDFVREYGSAVQAARAFAAAASAAERDDLEHCQEVAGVIELFDQRELDGELALDVGGDIAVEAFGRAGGR